MTPRSPTRRSSAARPSPTPARAASSCRGWAILKLVERVVKAVPLPVNAIAFPGAPSKAEWASAGIARISHGPFPHRALMAQLTEAAKAAIG